MPVSLACLPACLFALFTASHAVAAPPKTAAAPFAAPQDQARSTRFTPEFVATDGSVTIGGTPIAYTAVVGTIIVHPANWDDVAQDHPATAGTDDKPPLNEAAMSYVAYIKKGEPPEGRPITFIYNGGPGSSTLWLHMGAFGPRRVVTLDDSHTPAAPYGLVNNDESILDATDMVFIDAPGTGFGRIAGDGDKTKAFFGIDEDAHAFASFIQGFLSQYGRWNSPKYLFGESYGTTRSAVLSYMLANDYQIDLNGIMLLSQILSFDSDIDGPDGNPGLDTPYELALPSYAAIAWYHHRIPAQANPPADATGLPSFLAQVEQFATGDYATALAAGLTLTPAALDAAASKLHLYTGLSVDYLKKADLRVTGGEFEQNLLGDQNETTGRFDARFAGPTMDPLGKDTGGNDPQDNSIRSAYVSTFNDYVRRELHVPAAEVFKPVIDVEIWDMAHQQPGDGEPPHGTAANVMPDLAAALKVNPLLHVQLNQGYYDLATPFYAGVYEMRHLPIPQKLAANIEFRQYPSGHMVYAHPAALKLLHDNVVDFIARTHQAPATAQ